MPSSLLSNEELENLRSEIPKVQDLLEKDLNARTDFFNNPFSFLRNKFSIKLLGRIADFKELIKDFNESIKALFSKLRRFVNKCFACKFSALLLIYGALAKLGIPFTDLLEKIDGIVALLEEFFKGTSKDADKTTDRLKKAIDFFRPSTLALKFCELIGLCPATI